MVKRDEFLAMLSHELRNPLSPLRNASHMLMQGETQDPKIIWSRGVIERQLKHMIRLVDDLLDVSRIARGKIVLVSERGEGGGRSSPRRWKPCSRCSSRSASICEIEAADADLTRARRPGAARAGGRQPAAQRRQVHGRGRPHRARDARAATARAEIVRARQRHRHLRRVHAAHLRVVHADSERTRQSTSGGLGIGLALVRALVELHGGEISAASAGLDQGSEFTRAAAAVREQGADDERARRRCPRVEPVVPVRRNILIADDNQDALESLALMLRMEGHEVHCASDGEEALALAGQRRPEIVVLDVGMPKLDGCEVARRIRAESWGRDAVLVALTGWGQEVDRRRSREAGFDMHLVKPVDPATLCDMLVQQ